MKKLKYYKCSICGKKIDPDSLHVENLYTKKKMCLKCGLGITRRVQ